MSWLARSIANSLRLDNEEDEEPNDAVHPTSFSIRNQNSEGLRAEEGEEEEEEEDRGTDNQGRGVKEDLSELKETFARQFWGVASFLAPPPPPPPPSPSLPRPSRFNADLSLSNRNRWESSRRIGFADVCNKDETNSVRDSGIRTDFGSSEFRLEDAIGGAVGITEEVLAFARNIAHHPETWLDFPLSEEEDIDDFDMSNAQHQHALVVEYLAPRLRALRIELCPAHMSEGYFWNVYFVLLHSRLNKHDAELLSTPHIVQARAMWMQELQKYTKPNIDSFGRNTFSLKDNMHFLHDDIGPAFPNEASAASISLGTCTFEPTPYSVTTDFKTEKHPVVSTEIQYVDKSVIKEGPVIKTRDKEYEASSSFKLGAPDCDDDDDGDDWLKDSSELNGFGETVIFMGNEEDVSFSDLEDDDDCTMYTRSKIGSKDLTTSTKTS